MSKSSLHTPCAVRLLMAAARRSVPATLEKPMFRLSEPLLRDCLNLFAFKRLMGEQTVDNRHDQATFSSSCNANSTTSPSIASVLIE